MGRPAAEWFAERGLSLADADPAAAVQAAAGLAGGAAPGGAARGVRDIQRAPLFPVLAAAELSGDWVRGMLPGGGADSGFGRRWLAADRLSAEGISARANLDRLYGQRRALRDASLPSLAANAARSVFYQLDLKRLAGDWVRAGLEAPPPPAAGAAADLRFRDAMFRSELARRRGGDGEPESRRAFGELRAALLASADWRTEPRLGVLADQIVWGRSPARLDLAGGWSDTPPYCILNGGRVVNLAVDLNGQPPLQVFIRRSDRPAIVLRSIDNGGSEEIADYAALDRPAAPGSAFAVPRAALALAGFHPRFQLSPYPSLERQLREFGGGLELSFLAAIPKGSGLGTSSILAATLLGSLSDYCALGWTKADICRRTLILEQLLTTGGGWQDQYGGALPGVKLLTTEPGWQEAVDVRWLPDRLFAHPDTKELWLLYYTGITRAAKAILAEIVAGMFLNDRVRLARLDDIRAHADAAAAAIQKCSWEETGRVIARSWELNKALDPGTATPEIDAVVGRVADLAYGQKLLGAGGGGYLLIAAKDREAARRIRERLAAAPANPAARFVEPSLSAEGFQLSRS
jgi:galactokinase/mevalonate kinase-like predicted kinase